MNEQLFSWRFDGSDYWFLIGGGAMSNGELILEELEVIAHPLWHTTVVFHHDTGCFEEDPREFSEEDRARMRELLRALGYKKSERWSWKR